jgi:hypothetical protein
MIGRAGQGRVGRESYLSVFLPSVEDRGEEVGEGLKSVVSWIDSLGEAMLREMLTEGVSELVSLLDQQDESS